jgi:hypothetical protein
MCPEHFFCPGKNIPLMGQTILNVEKMIRQDLTTTLIKFMVKTLHKFP